MSEDISMVKGCTSVGIVGLDYCGSTLVNNVLSGLENCIGAGETHWILDKDRNPRTTGRCTECFSKDCPVFSDKILSRMRANGESSDGEWWRIIGEGANKNIVISGDKRPHHYERFGVPDKLLFIIKDPRAHIVSWATRKFSSSRESIKNYTEGKSNFKLTDDEFLEALRIWTRETRKHITWSLNSKKPLIAISLENFVDNKDGVLDTIANWIGTETNSNALKYWETDLHYIGSNHSVKRLDKDRYFFRQLKRDERWRDVLTDEQARLIVENVQVIEQLKRLQPNLVGKLEIMIN